jgi:aminoglycoside phosphotransferase family enzyme/predicted kinase
MTNDPTRQSPAVDAGAVVAGLQRHFERRGLTVERVETHISWVLLAGAFAFKIKKPVRLGFLDFGSLPARRHFCDEELRLNRRMAPTLYIAVLPIRDSADGITLEGGGAIVEYALKMHRLPPNALASERLAAGTLEASHLACFAARLAAFHREAPVAATASGHGTPERVHADMLQVLDALAALVDPAAADAVDAVRRWVDAQAPRLAPQWRRRLAEGRVREVHGDLHLDNIVVLEDVVTAFDCIEFDAELRWIDVMNDTAFAVMDLLARGRRDLAFGFLNTYLELGGDHDGITVLRHAIVYRALVRSLVAALRERERVARVGPSSADYLRLAQVQARDGQPRLLITHGLPGSGKSWLTQQLLERVGAMRVRSDVERARLPGPRGHGESDNERTYVRLAELARTSLCAGYPTIVDATFLERAQRDRLRTLAAESGVPFSILDCQAPIALLRERVRARSALGGDASDADLPVLEALAARPHGLDADEQAHAIVVQADALPDATALAGRWLAAPAPSAP